MTPEEFDIEFKKLEKEFRDRKIELKIKYAKDNNAYFEGNIIDDGNSIIRIEKITYSGVFGTNKSECVYHGPRLKKNLEPFKSGESGRIYQGNIKEKIS